MRKGMEDGRVDWESMAGARHGQWGRGSLDMCRRARHYCTRLCGLGIASGPQTRRFASGTGLFVQGAQAWDHTGHFQGTRHT